MRTKLIGTVASSKASKTLRVEVNRTHRHKVVGKYVKARTVCHVHDENEDAGEGDIVEIEECRPVSKLKRWRLVRIVEKSKEAAAIRALHENQQEDTNAEKEAAAIVEATGAEKASDDTADAASEDATESSSDDQATDES